MEEINDIAGKEIADTKAARFNVRVNDDFE